MSLIEMCFYSQIYGMQNNQPPVPTLYNLSDLICIQIYSLTYLSLLLKLQIHTACGLLLSRKILAWVHGGLYIYAMKMFRSQIEFIKTEKQLHSFSQRNFILKYSLNNTNCSKASYKFYSSPIYLYLIFEKSSLKLFSKIKLDKLDFYSILNLIFTACVAC